MLNDYCYKGFRRPQQQTLPLKVKGSIRGNFWQGVFITADNAGGCDERSEKFFCWAGYVFVV